MDFYLTPLAQAVDRHGRKATGLRSLIEAGAKVPDGIALDQVQVAQLLERDPRAISSLKTWLGQHQTQLAVRSSAANEDGEILSFAGMYATDLKIKPDIESVLASISRIATSGQSNRILHYSGSLVETIPVVIQEMVAAQISGVLFTRAILPNGDTGIYVEWIYGIGEQLVSGHITPASFSIPWNSQADALDLQQVIINRDFPDRRHINALITLVNIVAPLSAANRDIEWAIGSDDTLYALQIRPATTDILVPSTRPHGHPLPASPGIAVGPARLVDDTNYADLREGEVLVAKITEVDYVPSMRKAVAVVTEEGGLLSHAAIVARELAYPA